MKRHMLLILAVAIIAPCNSSPDEIEDFNRMSSSLSSMASEKTSSTDIKITEKKVVRKVEVKSQESERSAFLSSYLHQGHNLFFKPQILLGSNINNPPQPEEDNKEVVVTSTTEKIPEKKEEIKEENVDKLNDIPDPPTLSPLEIPKLPEVVVVKEPCPPDVKVTVIEKDTLIPPKFPVEILVPKPVPYIPSCLTNYNPYGVTIPCPPSVVLPPEVIDVDSLVEKKTIITSGTSGTLVPLPKIPLGAIYGRPVKTLMPYSEGFISTTRFLPSVGVSKISLKNFNSKSLVQVQDRTYSDVLLGRIPLRRKNVRVVEETIPISRSSSFSAFCAHNIALERVLPNIVKSKEVIEVARLSPILELPVRPVF